MRAVSSRSQRRDPPVDGKIIQANTAAHAAAATQAAAVPVSRINRYIGCLTSEDVKIG